MKITRYKDQYIDLNGHNWIGVHEIHQNRVLLHIGCECGQDDLLVVEDNELYGPDDFGVVLQVVIGYDDNQVPYCTIDLTGPHLASIRRMEENEGLTLQ